MTDGLEEVVERIIPELALSGEKGASIAEFLALIKEYSNGGALAVTTTSPAEVATDAPLSDAEMSFARVAWTWLTARSEVLVGGDKRWNRLTLDETLAFPEPQPTGDDSAAADPEDNHPLPKKVSLPARGMPARGPPRKKAKESRATLETRPRIHITEEAIWKRLTRHGVDYKRVPNSEWQCLLGIASSKREGILQVELRHVVNQDKRSVPKRTDFLAAKGYIVKRSLFAKGTKTSKLWIADLAPAMYPASDGVVPAKGSDMSKAALTKDASAVFWHKKWTGKDIDVEAFAESLIVIVKAWGVMRYSDLRAKMGVEELQWQMRTMSRLCRNLVDMGILRYAAATFLNSRKIWKDCIKFVRDPSEEEWAKVLATGKKTSKRHSTDKDQQRTASATPTKGKPPRSLKLTEESGEQEPGVAATNRPLPSGWVPEKPIIHTIFDAVKGAGPRGASTPQISSATIGYNFRRYVGSSLSNTRNNPQPAHLRKFEIGSELIRHGKTSTYMYSAIHATGSPGEADATHVDSTTPIENRDGALNPSTSSSITPSYGFSTTRPRTLARENGSSLSALSKAAKKGFKETPRQRRLYSPEPVRAEAEDPPASAADQERSAKRRRIETDGAPELWSHSDEATPVLQEAVPRKLPEKMPGKPPGVYIGEPGSLSPPRRKQGRPRKSLVVIFKSEKLKSPQFFENLPPPSSSFIPAIQNRDSGIEVEYNGHRGEIVLPRNSRDLVFNWKSERVDCEPIIIHLAELLGDPSAPLAPEGDYSRLVCITKGADEAESPQTHTFIFKDDPNGREHAVSLQGRIIAIRAKAEARAPVDSEAPQSPVPQVDDSPKPKGGRGRPGPKNGAGSGGKPFKCEKCGGAWKNDLGLKYHLTKAQNPCNPNFTSRPAAEERKKRRRMPVSVEEEQPGEEGGKKRGHRLHTARKRKIIRNPHRLIRGAPPTFRGLAVDDSQTRGVRHEQMDPKETPRKVPVSLSSPVAARKAGPLAVRNAAISPQVSSAQVSSPQVPTSALSIPGSTVQPPEKMEIDSPVIRGTKNVEALDDNIGDGPSAPDSQPESLSASMAVSSQPELRNELNVTPTPPSPRISEAVTSVEPQASHDRQPASPPPPTEKEKPLKPFKSTADYRGIFAESKVKTAQAMEIMEYLLENNGGVFPGDKALFYAVIRVFLKEFSGQSPPTFNNCKVALRNLDSKKRAREIFNAFRDTDGKLVVISMLVKTGLDPSGIVPVMLKRKIQDAHPNVFIPAAFSPSKEELKMLQELDREPPDSERGSKNGPVFRTRRDQLGEPGADLEVLDAPYYSQNMDSNGADGLAVWVHGQGQKQPRRLTMKRQRESDAIQLIERSPMKKARTASGSAIGQPMVATNNRTVTAIANSSEALNEPTEHHWESHIAESPTGNTWRHMAKESRDRELGEFSGAPYMSQFDPLNTQPTSVAAAIKLFDLLPPKRRGPRKSYQTSAKAARKLGRLGRRKNPGLDSLPAGFFTNSGRGITARQSLRFLEPNMDLGNLDEFASEDEEFPQSPDTNSSTLSERISLVSSFDLGRDGFVFVPSVVLKDKTPGLWSSLGIRYFSEETRDASFVMDGQFPDRVFLLSQNMPVDVEDIISRSKGRFGRRAAWTDTLLGKFCITTDRIMNWELSQEGTALLSADVAMPDYVYINLTATEARASMAAITPVWSAKNMFGLDTLPYDELEDEMLEKDEIHTQKSHDRLRKDPISAQSTFTFGKSANPDRKGKPGRKSFRVVPLGKSRQHTAYPRSADEYIVADENGQGKEDWYSESTRLAAFICVTTLMGGVSQSVDWGLLMRLFPNMTLSSLRRFWGDARKDRRSSLLTLTEKFRRGFLRAYENSELPPIDFDNVLAYDWKFLTIWTRKLLVTDAGATSLPASSKELDNQNLAVADPTFKSRDWRETYFHPVRSYFDRFQDASSQAISIPVDKGREAAAPGVVVAMSWIRALYVTPPGRYPTQAVHRRLNMLCGLPPAERTKLIEEASYKLRDQIMIARASRIATDGRPWKLNGRVLKVLEKAAQGPKYAEAVEFKKQLDACFRQGKKAVVKYVCNDGMIMAILNLHAHQRVNLETTGQPNVPLGYEPFNYETRKYPKKYHHFKMHISPTASYLYDDDAELAELRGCIMAAHPPSEGPHGEIPLWCDIFGQIDKGRWLQCLGAVFFMLSSRGAAGAGPLAVALKPSLMTFETQLILDWGCKLGLLRPRVEGTAPAPAEWWWLVVEAQRAARLQNRLGEGTGGESRLAGASPPTTAVGNPDAESVPHVLALAASGSAEGDAMDVDG